MINFLYRRFKEKERREQTMELGEIARELLDDKAAVGIRIKEKTREDFLRLVAKVRPELNLPELKWTDELRDLHNRLMTGEFEKQHEWDKFKYPKAVMQVGCTEREGQRLVILSLNYSFGTFPIAIPEMLFKVGKS